MAPDRWPIRQSTLSSVWGAVPPWHGHLLKSVPSPTRHPTTHLHKTAPASGPAAPSALNALPFSSLDSGSGAIRGAVLEPAPVRAESTYSRTPYTPGLPRFFKIKRTWDERPSTFPAGLRACVLALGASTPRVTWNDSKARTFHNK